MCPTNNTCLDIVRDIRVIQTRCPATFMFLCPPAVRQMTSPLASRPVWRRGLGPSLAAGDTALPLYSFSDCLYMHKQCMHVSACQRPI